MMPVYPSATPVAVELAQEVADRGRDAAMAATAQRPMQC